MIANGFRGASFLGTGETGRRLWLIMNSLNEASNSSSEYVFFSVIMCLIPENFTIPSSFSDFWPWEYWRQTGGVATPGGCLVLLIPESFINRTHIIFVGFLGSTMVYPMLDPLHKWHLFTSKVVYHDPITECWDKLTVPVLVFFVRYPQIQSSWVTPPFRTYGDIIFVQRFPWSWLGVVKHGLVEHPPI